MRDDLGTALAGRYDIERELGHGGMAIVYLARDVRHGRHVAVKVLRPELSTSLGAERFLREINIAARLTHPNILALHDSGEAAGMLYFVMPHVEGETLRDRLDRERQLPLDEALAIARQVGLALDYAHERGVIHRDIKPENILLLGDHVLVADFGLARALHTAGTNRLTESAVAVGTPAYMSPEQAAADPEVDGRTDLYSLACVLFEMIAGAPPFKGANAAALLAQHLTAKPPSICGQRPHCPPNVDAAVARALEKTPADRFRTARDFYAALTAAPASLSPAATPAPGASRLLSPRSRLLAISGAVIAVAGVAVLLAVSRGRHAGEAGGLPDANSFAVLPLSAADPGARADTALIASRLADALGEWDGVRVVSGREVADQVASARRGGPLRLDDALDVARALGAAKLVWGELSTAAGAHGPEHTARLTLYDVATGRALRPAVLTWPAAGADAPDARLTANRLLRRRDELPWGGRTAVEHPSLAAWVAYDSAREALDRWDIADARRQLRSALAVDATLPQGNLWLSLVEMWSGTPRDRWRANARRAEAMRDHLDPRDTALATAQLALGEGRYPDACAAYGRYVALDTTAVIGWYGLGECESRDSLVVRDGASPSGWKFRGSMQHAINAYMHIVDDGGPPQPTFVYTRLSQLLFTSGVKLRPGHSEGAARIEFGASPTLDADTLAFVPYALDRRGQAMPPTPLAPGKAAALEHNRALLRRLYRTWADNAPATVEAHAALATLLEALEELGVDDGSRLSALAQIRSARRLSTDPAERLQLAATELRFLVKAAEWSGAAAFTDSLFAANPQPAADTTGALASAAAMSGRIRALAAILAARNGGPSFELTLPDGSPLDVSPVLEQDAARTFAFALSGACIDSVREYRARIERQLASYIADPVQREQTRGVLLRRPLSVAVPCVGPAALTGIDAAGDRMVQLEQALAAHDRAAFGAIYGRMAAARSRNRPGDNALDYTYMESWMFAALGDSAAAVRHLDESLGALTTLGAYLSDYPAQSAALVRAMGLRAELAAAAGDRATAARWGAAVSTLWMHADPELQPYVGRMRALALAGSRDTSRRAGH